MALLTTLPAFGVLLLIDPPQQLSNSVRDRLTQHVRVKRPQSRADAGAHRLEVVDATTSRSTPIHPISDIGSPTLFTVIAPLLDPRQLGFFFGE
jgi:hypothetical protein